MSNLLRMFWDVNKDGRNASGDGGLREALRGVIAAGGGEVARDCDDAGLAEAARALGQRLAGARRREAVARRGIPQGLAARYLALAEAVAGDGDGFEAALDAAVAAFPPGEMGDGDDGVGDDGEGRGGGAGGGAGGAEGARAGAGVARIAASARGEAVTRSWRQMTLGERAALYARDAGLAREMARAAGENLE